VVKRVSTPLIWAALLGFVVGTLWLVAVRFVTYKSDAVHYHANFALYINGQRDEFKSFTFYEEVAACNADEADNPKTRVHMHDQKPGLVHVHAPAVTWGQFFENLSYTLGDSLVKTDKGVFINGQDGNKLTFILNGHTVDAVANSVIKSEDRLLINYGQDDAAVLQQRYITVPNDAHKANTQADPASCSGSKPSSFSERLQQAVGL
jgi:hypothetical protein